MKKLFAAPFALFLTQAAEAQVPYDPPTATKAAPNVFLILDASRTTLISSTCGSCHERSDTSGGDPYLHARGRTRLAMTRRALTGGWGWNSAYVDGTEGASNAFDRPDGIMDQYKIRWGVIFYDGLGARMVLNPTVDGPNKVAQKAVIDLGRPGYGENLGSGTLSTPPYGPLNSWFPYWNTASHSPGWLSSVSDAASGFNIGARQARAVRLFRDYLHSTTNVPQWTPPNAAAAAEFGLGSAESPINATAIHGDPANVLASPAGIGCRRNFGIMLMDGHGSGHIPTSGMSNYVAATDSADQGRYAPAIAREIYNMGRNGGGFGPGPQIAETNLRNQLFVIRFGHHDYRASADAIADAGFDGVIGDGPLAFLGTDAAGNLNDLSPLYAAFASIFQLILDGQYLSSTPSITRTGEARVISRFNIQNCTSALPYQCNIGRIGHLDRELDTDGDGSFDDGTLSFSDKLRNRAWNDRTVYTSYNASDANCTARGTCGGGATMVRFRGDIAPGSDTVPAVAGTHYEFLLGNPSAAFSNGVARGDTRNSMFLYPPIAGPVTDPWRDPYKISDIANSRPVVVGAPSGIGEDINRWNDFLDMPRTRNHAYGAPQTGNGSSVPTRYRDEVVYIGGNDGMLHAFLSRRHSGTPLPGRTTRYIDTAPFTVCPSEDPGYDSNGRATNPVTYQATQPDCIGKELWGYSPRMLHGVLGTIRGGHYFMVDGTPIVSDVLFTKADSTPTGPDCDQETDLPCTNQWDYRTVLLQCLGGGGPGCFALDVSNPHAPMLLWERTLQNHPGTTRLTSTSKPQIVRMRRSVAGVYIPYYVALMGGGMGESTGVTPAGSFLAVGLEDGAVSYSSATSPSPFASSPSCLDSDNDSFVDTCYITNEIAQVWKVRFPNGVPSTATMTMEMVFDGRAHLFGLGLVGFDTIRTYNRIIATFDRNRDLRLFFGTGNFEDVQNATEQNYIFEIMDTDPSASSGATVVAGNHCGANGIIPLGTREKVIFDGVISHGVALFTSYAPDVNVCLPGDAFLYGVSYDSCAPALDDDPDPNVENLVNKIEFLDSGLPSAPVVNEATGSVSVALDNGTIQENAASLPLAAELPVSKLWWRLVR